VNEVLAVMLMAAKYKKPVCPHAGGVGLCEYVQHLSMIDYLCISTRIDDRVSGHEGGGGTDAHDRVSGHAPFCRVLAVVHGGHIRCGDAPCDPCVWPVRVTRACGPCVGPVRVTRVYDPCV
jgi:hypothetical protein